MSWGPPLLPVNFLFDFLHALSYLSSKLVLGAFRSLLHATLATLQEPALLLGSENMNQRSLQFALWLFPSKYEV